MEQSPRVAPDEDLVTENGGVWTSQLQAIVDEASRVIGRPMVISGRHRLLAHTEHSEDELDRVRRMSIMKQTFPAEVIEWGRQNGAWSSERPFRFPPNPQLEYEARAVAPIRCQGHLLGLLSCIDRDATITDDDLERMGAFADEAGVVLYREVLLQDLARSRERELLRDILSTDEEIRRRAAWQLAEHDLFTPRGRVVVLVVPLQQSDDDASPESSETAVDAVLMRIRRQLAPKHGLHLVRPSHALILASVADPGIRTQGVAAFAARVHQEIATSPAIHAEGHRHIVTAGGIVRGLASATISYDQALRAANVAATVSSFGEVVCWDDLGVYRMLTELPIDSLTTNALHPGLKALVDDSRSPDLVTTLERYLDLGCDARKAAASLYLHRATLYNRLHRIENAADVDLSSGDDRLALHLSLKLARLQGITLGGD